MQKLITLVVLFAVVAFASATTSKSDALITDLPDVDFTPNFDQYAGYVTLEGTTKNIFYWFVESQNDPDNDPVILWLQGGPGCSSLGGGLMLENGPFYPRAINYTTGESGLTSNPFSWNTIANMLYIESPCGVGFSYGGKPEDYTSDDNTTAYDNYLFLDGFFDVYTDFADNEFWITGESYAGVYIPTLAYQILNNGTNTQLANNLKAGGLSLGNPVTNCGGPSYDGTDDSLLLNDQVQLYYWHGMTSRDYYDSWINAGCNTGTPQNGFVCFELYAKISQSIGTLDQPLLFEDAAHLRNQRIVENRIGKPQQRLTPPGAIDPDMLYFSFCTGNGTLDFATDINPSCLTLDDQVSNYLNRADVQSAIHAQPTEWSECGGVLYTSDAGPIPDYLDNFFQVAPTMKILYYSGDVDIATVPFAGTQRCLATLDRPIVDEWKPYLVNNEVGGYVEVYDTYTYATIKGAGHEAPQYQPAIAYELITSFILGNPLNTK